MLTLGHEVKLHGKQAPGPSLSYIAFPRDDQDTIIFQVRSLTGALSFTQRYPEPKPPSVILRGGAHSFDYEDEDYIKNKKEYDDAVHNYTLYVAVKETEGLAFDNVKEADYRTFVNVEKELKEWLTDYEYNRLISKVYEVNGITSAKIEAATNEFIAKMSAGLVGYQA